MTDTLTMDREATDLLPMEHDDQPYEAGTLESELGATQQVSIRPNLTLDEAADAFDDDAGHAPAAKDSRVLVTIGGQPLTLPDLVNGYVQGVARQDAVAGLYADYGKVVEAAQHVVQGALALAGYINSKLPPLPSADLSVTDPIAYTRLKAVHDETHGIVQQILQMASHVGQSTAAVANEHHINKVTSEAGRLIHFFPECADPAEREKFLGRVREAVYSCDFSESELREVVDHRLFRLAHLASVGLEKEGAPKVRREVQRPAPKASGAMERLSETGSLLDALNVDFD